MNQVTTKFLQGSQTKLVPALGEPSQLSFMINSLFIRHAINFLKL